MRTPYDCDRRELIVVHLAGEKCCASGVMPKIFDITALLSGLRGEMFSFELTEVDDEELNRGTVPQSVVM